MFSSMSYLGNLSINQKIEGGLRLKGIRKEATYGMPLVTVVTVVLNGKNYLERTIKSVISQSYSNIEYLIIDGGSQDGTLDIIRQYENHIDYWISEIDSSLYEAMNKAFSLASGYFVNFLNAGDYFYDSYVLERMDFNNCLDSLIGKALFYSKKVKKAYIAEYSSKTSPHQAFFMARKHFESIKFNTSLKYCADFDLFQRLKRNKCLIYKRDVIVSKNSFGGISTHPKYLIERMKEHLRIGVNHPIRVLLRFIPKILLFQVVSPQMAEHLYFFLRQDTFDLET